MSTTRQSSLGSGVRRRNGATGPQARLGTCRRPPAEPALVWLRGLVLLGVLVAAILLVLVARKIDAKQAAVSRPSAPPPLASPAPQAPSLPGPAAWKPGGFAVAGSALPTERRAQPGPPVPAGRGGPSAAGTVARTPESKSAVKSAPVAGAAAERPPQPRDVPPRPLFPSLQLSPLDEYVAGPGGHLAQSEKVFIVEFQSLQTEANGASFIVTRLVQGLKGNLDPTLTEWLFPCKNPQAEFGVQAETARGRKFVVFMDKDDRFFILTLADYERTQKTAAH